MRRYAQLLRKRNLDINRSLAGYSYFFFLGLRVPGLRCGVAQRFVAS